MVGLFGCSFLICLYTYTKLALFNFYVYIFEYKLISDMT